MKSGHNVIDAYNFILSWAVAHKGNTPSQRKIAQECDFAIGTAHTCVATLIKEGLLERIDGDLCVVKAEFTLDADAANIPATNNRVWHLSDMNVIPQDMSDEDRWRLADAGVYIGKSVNDLFNKAEYPEGWRYERIESDDQEAYLLSDDRGVYRAIVHYHGKGKARSVTLTMLNG